LLDKENMLVNEDKSEIPNANAHTLKMDQFKEDVLGAKDESGRRG
jgi:hypothetical protein